MLKCHKTFSTQMVLFQKVTILFIGKSRFVLIVLAAVCFGSVAILNKVVLEQQSKCLVNYFFNMYTTLSLLHYMIRQPLTKFVKDSAKP